MSAPRQHVDDRSRQPAPLDAVAPPQREPILDVLRGVAVLGILLVNVDFMRGPDGFGAFWSTAPAAYDQAADRIAQFAVGWLATGKFLSSFAMMFGAGAALMSARAFETRASPRPLLKRRYLWLIVLGLAHMTLLFPGDILLSYGITGLLMLAFVHKPPRSLIRWGLVFLVGTALLMAWLSALAPWEDPDAGAAWAAAERAATVAAFQQGGYRDIVAMHVWQSVWLQIPALLFVPWTLGLFLFGFAAARSGLLAALGQRPELFRRAAAIGLGLGLPANFVLGFFGPLGALAADPMLHGTALIVAGALAQLLAAPLLAIGYLSAIVLACQRFGVPRPLARIGRMALSAYLLESALALLAFAGFGLYDRVGPFDALLLVALIWSCVLVFCNVWATRFRYGPAEWLWRSLTYRRLQPMRIAS